MGDNPFSLFAESKEVMEALDIFDAPEIQNPELSNMERFKILKQHPQEKGNLKYTEMFGDIMDRHEAVFEAIDEVIEKRSIEHNNDL